MAIRKQCHSKQYKINAGLLSYDTRGNHRNKMKPKWIIYIILACLLQTIINSGCASTAGLGQSPGAFQKCNKGLELDCWYSHKEKSGYDKNGHRYYNPQLECRCVKPGEYAIFYMTADEANYFQYHEP